MITGPLKSISVKWPIKRQRPGKHHWEVSAEKTQRDIWLGIDPPAELGLLKPQEPLLLVMAVQGLLRTNAMCSVPTPEALLQAATTGLLLVGSFISSSTPVAPATQAISTQDLPPPENLPKGSSDGCSSLFLQQDMPSHSFLLWTIWRPC